MGQAAAAAAAAAAFHLNNSNPIANNAKITDSVLSRRVCNSFFNEKKNYRIF